MNNEVMATAVVQKRKLLLKAPMLMVPMLALLFYALGGGKGVAATGPGVVRGINMTLPAAKLDSKGKTPDKMELYAKAAQDSVRWMEKKKQDPYAARVGADSVHGGGVQGLQMGTSSRQLASDAAADKVLERLGQMKALIGSKEALVGVEGQDVAGTNDLTRIAAPGYSSPNPIKNTRQNSDPELSKLDGMLNKLIRIQHPEMAGVDTQAKPAGIPNRLEVAGHDEAVRVLGEAAAEATGFMEIGDEDAVDSPRGGHTEAIEALIDGDQTLTAGATVAMRLTQETSVGGVRIPAGQAVYGLASMNGERLLVHVTSLRVGQSIVDVSLQVYDLDGLAGIRVPGALTRDVSKESASEALGGLGVASLDPGLGAQAAGAGLQLAKTLASRKIRLVRVMLPDGYKVLLKNSKR